MDIKEQFIPQLSVLVTEHADLRRRSEVDDLSDLPDHEHIQLVTRMQAAIHRICEKSSVYVDQCEKIIKTRGFPAHQAKDLLGVVLALRDDLDAGYLRSVTELIHGELFADFLEMAKHLLDEAYKDAAAVIAGSSLEAHLRQLCQKVGIDIMNHKEDGSSSPKKADSLNAELKKQNVYSQLDQKNVTSWLDLRNNAAHGNYEKYEATQVGLMISGIRDFITRNPA